MENCHRVRHKQGGEEGNRCNGFQSKGVDIYWPKPRGTNWLQKSKKIKKYSLKGRTCETESLPSSCCSGDLGKQQLRACARDSQCPGQICKAPQVKLIDIRCNCSKCCSQKAAMNVP